MREAIINHRARRERGQHPGLLLRHFLVEHNNPDERRNLLSAAIAASRNPTLIELYSQAYRRWRDGLMGPNAVLRTTGRLIVGLGEESVLETGIRLHRTYGVPIISGSGLKGLSCHYADRVWGQRHLGAGASSENLQFRRNGQYHNLLFGTTDDGGVVRFEDAWLVPESLTADREGLVLDVMTPHHQQWQTNPAAAPTDFDSPMPVAYLSVTGTFHIAVNWQGPTDHPEAEAWMNLAFALVKEALREWGAGGKTTSGYGRLAEQTQASMGPPLNTGSSTEKRPAGKQVQVTILATRPKGGFDVQEPGRPPGTLTLGKPPTGVQIEIGAVVNVVIHNDDPRKPQYRWA